MDSIEDWLEGFRAMCVLDQQPSRIRFSDRQRGYARRLRRNLVTLRVPHCLVPPPPMLVFQDGVLQLIDPWAGLRRRRLRRAQQPQHVA